MQNYFRCFSCLFAGYCVLVLALPVRAAESTTLTVKVDKPGIKISPMLYGLMTEEINHAYDGGLYAELLQNRNFSDTLEPGANPRRPMPIPPAMTQPWSPPAVPLHWSVLMDSSVHASIHTDDQNPVNKTGLRQSMRLDLEGNGKAGVANDGYWGIPVKPDTEYKASFYARASAAFKGPLSVSIESDNHSFASAEVPTVGTEWKQYSVTLKTGKISPVIANHFVIRANGTFPADTKIWFSLVSLFPPTFHNRPNGNRADLMEFLDAMHPSFLRFPGGNYLQGDYFNERFNWKETIGPLENRPGHHTPWNYRSSDGMGLLEFLNWCEDLKIEPVVGVFAGFSLRRQGVSAGPDLEPFVQEALEEIEYITGGPDTPWGARRAKDGHPTPFKLTYVEIGNEDSFDNVPGRYNGRFTQFHDAIKAKYPQLQLISTTSGNAAPTTRKPDVVDDHYYRTPELMAGDVHHYDPQKYPRTGPKIFVGEWASREAGNQRTQTPSLKAALGDAAWMTGLERNSDIVIMAAYAPLLVNINPRAAQWPTDLIGFDAGGSFGSPSYYAQVMFGQNKGDVVLPVDVQPVELPTAETLFSTASRDNATGDVIVKFVNTRATAEQIKISLQGVKEISSGWVDVLTGAPTDLNSIAEPQTVSPKRLQLAPKMSEFSQEIFPYSINVFRFKVR